jgi:chromosome segregation ATPase
VFGKKKQRIKELEAKVDSLAGEIDNLEAKLDEATIKIGGLESDLLEAQKECADMEAEYEAEADSLRNAVRTANEERDMYMHANGRAASSLHGWRVNVEALKGRIRLLEAKGLRLTAADHEKAEREAVRFMGGTPPAAEDWEQFTAADAAAESAAQSRAREEAAKTE